MAEEVVVKEELTRDMVAAGHKLTELLRQDQDFGILCSLWLYSSESNRWKLTLGTPVVDNSGPIHAYQLIQGIVTNDWQEQWDIHPYNISVLRSNHSLVTAVRSLKHFEPPDVRGAKRVTFTRVEDVFIEDALIYYIA